MGLHPFPAPQGAQLAEGEAPLSGGEQQMLAVGRALMSRPDLLMLDEPSLGLAPLLVREIFEIIKRINAEGKTVLLVEQNAFAALSVAHYAYILEVGRVVLEVRAGNCWKIPKSRKPIWAADAWAARAFQVLTVLGAVSKLGFSFSAKGASRYRAGGLLEPFTAKQCYGSQGLPTAKAPLCRERRIRRISMKDFCTCANKACPLHPSRHDKGCSPCIEKNLRLREIPNCFVKLVKEDVDLNASYTLETFADVIRQSKQNA